jgi:Chalcone isomerase-like
MPTPSNTPRRRLVIAAACSAVLLAALPRPARATRSIKVEGLAFAGDIVLAGTPLQLNGVGLRAVAWLKGYAAALYLPRRASTVAQVLAQANAPRRLQLRMLQEVEAEEFVKAFHKGVERNTPAPEAARLAERAARFVAQVRALVKLRKRDVIDLDFLPGRGLQLSRNGTPGGEPIAGDDLYAALLRCFIGERPADPDMKIGLLGGPVG